MTAPTPRPPAVQRLGAAVLLQGPAVARLAYLATRGARACESGDGLRIAGSTRELLGALTAAAAATQGEMSPAGHADVPERLEATSSGVRVCTAEAADLLRLSVRQVRRLGSELDGQLVGGRWTYDAATVRALAAQRDATNEE